MSRTRSKTSPPPPPLPVPVPLPAPGTDALEIEKKRLEIEKLREEIAEARESQRWRRKAIRDVKASEWLTALAALVAVGAAFWTGLFNTTRERLAAQGDRLAVEKIDLEQKRDRLSVEVAAAEKELADVKARLAPFEQEANAVHALRGFKAKLLDVRFAVTPDADGYRVSIDHRPEKLEFHALGPAQAHVNPSLADALDLVNRFRSLKGIRVQGVRLGTEDAPLLCRHREIESLTLVEADIDRSVLTTLRLPNLRTINVRGNKVDSLEGCGPFPSVKSVDLSHNPLGDDGVATLITAVPNVTSLNLMHTKITETGLTHLVKLPKLLWVNLIGTTVTGDGLAKVVANRTMSVRVRKGSVSAQTKAVLKSVNPNSFWLEELDSDQIVLNAFRDVNDW